MIYINKKETLNSFSELFNHQNKLTSYNKTFMFERFIDKVLSFNKKITFESSYTNLKIINSAEELIKIFQLRSEIYGNLGYQKQFPDYLPNMNFDRFDLNSAIIYTQTNAEVTSTCRLIFDSKMKLPIEERLDLSQIREKFSNISEMSRIMVKKDTSGLNLDFKCLMAGIYYLMKQNNLDATTAICLKEHYKLYSKLGGVKIEKELDFYGDLDKPFIVSTWNHTEISKFFQKAFLKAA